MNKIKLIKYNAKLDNYIFTKGSNHFVAFTLPNGINGIHTTKNFYVDTKTMKIRYTSMTGDNASYNELRDYYLEIADGIYLFMLGGSDDLHNLTITRLNIYSSAWEDLEHCAEVIIELAKEI